MGGDNKGFSMTEKKATKSQDTITDADRFNMIAHDFVDGKNVICFKGNFYLFNEGIWRLESDENTEAWIYSEYFKKFSKAIRKNAIAEIVQVIKHLTYENEIYRKKIKYMDEIRIGNTINVKSGVLDLDTMVTKPYNLEDFCFHKLGFDYKPSPNVPTMLKFLSTSMGFEWPLKEETEEWKNIIGFIQEFMGYSLVTGNKFEKALILTGRGRNGKGTLIHVWSRILGDYNVSSLDLASLNDNQMVGQTRNKLVNFCYDADSNIQLDTGVAKSAIVGEPVNCNEKWKEPQSFVFTAKLVIACNDLPFTRNSDDSVRERFFVIPFDKAFSSEERDPELKSKLSLEVGEIFSWAVEGLIRLRKRGKFIVPERFVTSLEQFLFDNDTVAQWLADGERLDPNRRCKRSDAWKGYVAFCKETSMKNYKQSKFFRQIEKKGIKFTLLHGIWYMNGIKPEEVVSGISDDDDTYIKQKPVEELPDFLK